MVPVCPGYGIKERLGEGGFGTVYRAERKKDRRVRSSDLPQLITSQVYAIKVVKLSAGMSNLDLLEEEIYALSQLSHPNVVSFIEVVEHKSVKHVVMEYCGRGDLRKFLNFHLELWCVALLLTSRYTPRLQPGCYAYYYIQRNRSRVKNQVYLRATPTSSASLSSLVLRRVVVTASGYQARKW